MNRIQKLLVHLRDTDAAAGQLNELSSENPVDDAFVFNLRAIQKRKSDLQRRLDMELRETTLENIQNNISDERDDFFPIQNMEPHFRVNEDGKIDFSDLFDIRRENLEHLKSLHPILQSMCDDLARILEPANYPPYQYLRERVSAYAALIGHDIDDLSFSRLSVEGLRLDRAAALIRDMDVPPLNAEMRETIESLSELHHVFILSTPEGRELEMARLRVHPFSLQEEVGYGTAVVEFAKAMRSWPDLIDPVAATSVLAAVEQLRKPERTQSLQVSIQSSAVSAAAISILIVLSAIAIVSGSAVLGVVAGASLLVGGEGLKRSKTYTSLVSLVVRGLDRLSDGAIAGVGGHVEGPKSYLKFLPLAETQLRRLSHAGLRWIERVLDWGKGRNSNE